MVLVDAQRLAQCGRFDEMLAICRGMLDASDANVATLLDIGALLYGYENRGLSPILLHIHQHHQFNCPKLIVPLLLRNSRSSSPLALVGSLLAACALALALAWSCAWASWPSVCKCCMDSN